MNVMTCEQIRYKDSMAMMRFGMTGLLLMEHAAMAVVEEMERRDLLGGRIVAVCGAGNNGGDGYAVARLLHQKGADVTVVDLFDRPPKGADALACYQMAQKIGLPFGALEDADHADVIVDAIFGTGMDRELNEFCAAAVERINASPAFRVSVDLPSGMNGDEAYQQNRMVNADLTVTFTAYKPGLLFYPSAAAAGEVVARSIGIPDTLGDDRTRVIERETLREMLPKRERTGHKNTFGHLLVAGASTGMTGAVALCSEAGLRGGCGLVTAAVPSTLHAVMEQKLTEVMTVPLSDDGTGRLAPSAQEAFSALTDRASVTVFGPGAGTGAGTEHLLHSLLMQSSPVVIDADGLNVLARHLQWLGERECETCILTPHPGEMARLAATSVSAIEENRIEFAREFATRYHVILVLKGAVTVIADEKGTVFVNRFGNSGMATAGSGDVLAGLIGSFAAQGADGCSAAVCGVGVHALAGDRLRERIGEYGICAGDLAREIPTVLRELSN